MRNSVFGIFPISASTICASFIDGHGLFERFLCRMHSEAPTTEAIEIFESNGVSEGNGFRMGDISGNLGQGSGLFGFITNC